MNALRTHLAVVLLVMGMAGIPVLGLAAGTDMQTSSGKATMSLPDGAKKEMSAPMDKAMDTPMPGDMTGAETTMKKSAGETMDAAPAMEMEPKPMPEAGDMEQKAKDAM